MGYAGNNAPSHIIQTLLADHVEKVIIKRSIDLFLEWCANQ